MRYRPEIDGLRAVAVAAVILFHAGFPLLCGGFVGVDVFFTISGFLITSIIVEDLESGRFSLVRFYERRARRILPALFVVMVACVPVAYRFLAPDDLKDFAQSLAAISLFSSNILFWGESGYFDTQAELKPLLHTWSLAVEEQFYVLFPLLLLLSVRRLGRGGMLVIIGCIAVFSLAVSIHEVRHFPPAAFYLLPSRAWQLLVGAIAAVAFSRPGEMTTSPASRLGNECLGWGGLLAILAALVVYDEQTPFPGLNAALPTVGAACILLGASGQTVVGRALAWRPLVGLGLISYSAYLWHQPLFAFARYASLGELSTGLAVVLCAMTLVLACLSWRYVEQPVRNPAVFGRAQVWALAAVGMALFIGLGVIGHRFSDGITEFRLRGVDPRVRAKCPARESLVADRKEFVARFLPAAEEAFTPDGARKRVLILGDSLSEDLYAAVMANGGLFPGLEFRRLKLDEPCMAAAAQLVTTGALPPISDEKTCRGSLERLRDGGWLAAADAVVLCSNWPRYITHSTHEGALMLAEALAGQGRQVRIVGLLSIQDASSTAFFAARNGLTADAGNRAAYQTVQRSKIDRPNSEARALASRFPTIRYLDKYAIFCDDAGRTTLLFDRDERMLFADNFHLTAVGGLFFGAQIAARGWFDGL